MDTAVRAGRPMAGRPVVPRPREARPLGTGLPAPRPDATAWPLAFRVQGQATPGPETDGVGPRRRRPREKLPRVEDVDDAPAVPPVGDAARHVRVAPPPAALGPRSFRRAGGVPFTDVRPPVRRGFRVRLAVRRPASPGRPAPSRVGQT